MDSIKPARKYGLDFLKGIAACFVVFMHVQFPDRSGRIIALIGTFAVPIFFMTSGYFGYGASKEKTLRSIKKTSVYLLVAYVLGLVTVLLVKQFDPALLKEYFKTEIFTTKHIVHFLLFTDTKICGVAWFLISLLWCYVLKYYLGVKLRYIAYIGLFIRVFGAIQYPFLRITVPVNTPWVTGIPFFIIGELIREHEAWIREKIPSWILLIQGLVGFAILMSALFYRSLFWFIGILLLSPALFVLFSRIDMKYNRICLLGSTYAFFVYITHPLMMRIYDAVRTDQSMAEKWARPVIVLLFTVLMAWIYYSAKRYFVKK